MAAISIIISNTTPHAATMDIEGAAYIEGDASAHSWFTTVAHGDTAAVINAAIVAAAIAVCEAETEFIVGASNKTVFGGALAA